MNIFKKVAACFAAATVMTSMAVTASADYQIEGKEFDDHYSLQISGIPQSVFDYQVASFEIRFKNSDGSDNPKFIHYDLFLHDNGKFRCYVTDKDLIKESNVYENLDIGIMVLENDEWGWTIQFDKDDEYLAEFMKCTEGWLGLIGGTLSNNGGEYQSVFFNSNGDTRAESYFEPVSFTWEALNSASEPASEPTSSEPASEPVSSEPVSEPAASEPVSSETTASQPSNVDTGTAGVAAVVGTAVLAAGAVIVTRKKK